MYTASHRDCDNERNIIGHHHHHFSKRRSFLQGIIIILPCSQSSHWVHLQSPAVVTGLHASLAVNCCRYLEVKSSYILHWSVGGCSSPLPSRELVDGDATVCDSRPDLRLPSQLAPVPNYTAWWQTHMSMSAATGVQSTTCWLQVQRPTTTPYNHAVLCLAVADSRVSRRIFVCRKSTEKNSG